MIWYTEEWDNNMSKLSSLSLNEKCSYKFQVGSQVEEGDEEDEVVENDLLIFQDGRCSNH